MNNDPNIIEIEMSRDEGRTWTKTKAARGSLVILNLSTSDTWIDEAVGIHYRKIQS